MKCQDYRKLTDAIYDADGAAQQMANIQLDNLSGQLDILKSAVEGFEIEFFQSVGNPITSVVTAAAEAVSHLTDTFRNEGLSGAIRELGGLAANALTSLASAAPSFIDTAAELVQSFLSGLRENLPEIATAALDIVGSLAGGIVETLPELVQTGIDLIAALAEGLADALPDLIPSAVDMVLQLYETITDPDNLSNLADAALEIILALADGLIDSLPDLIEKVPKIVGNLVDAIIENAPKLLDAAFELITKLAAGIVDNLPEIFAKGKEIVEKLISGILELFWKLTDKGKEIIGSVKDGVKQKIEDAKNWGKDLIDNFIGGIKQKWNDLKNTVSDLANTVKSFLGFSEPEKGPLSNFHTYAPDMMKLFAKGINDNAGMLKSAFDKALDFGTASESLVEKEIPKTERAVSKQLAGLTDRVRAAVEAETANISVGLTAKGNGYDPPEPAPNGSLVVNVYTGSGTPESAEKARNLGRELGQETARELRRRGMAPT